MLKIEKIIESQKFVSDPREYLGASQIGNPCSRALWYSFRFATKPEPHTAREERLFNRGNIEEPVIEADLKRAGAKQVSSQQKTSFAAKSTE